MPKTITDIIIKIPAKKKINQTIVIINEIRLLTNINRTEKELLALVSQLDKSFHCTAFNAYLANAMNCSTVYIQKMLAKLERLSYISRTITNGYIRKITSIFAHFFQKSIYPHIQQNTNKENLNQNSTIIPSKEKKIKQLLDLELTELEQIDYQLYIEKKGDYTTVNYLNIYFHKGWLKWFKTNQKVKAKGQAIANLLRNGKNKLLNSFSSNKQYSETWKANNKLNSILNKYA